MELDINKVFEGKPAAENKRVVLTYPQKSIRQAFGIEEKEQTELITKLCERLTNKKGLTEHQKAVCIFGILYNLNEKLIVKANK